jgi:ATP-dependent helicase/DNAse subunit B
VTVEILLAPAGGGKTAHAIGRIRALPPLSPVRVLVPDQMKAVAFRRRLAETGGALGVEVQTFYRLYADVLALAGASGGGMHWESASHLARLPSPVRYRLIRHLVAQLCDAGQVSYYAPLQAAPGFGRLLADLFEELKRARVFPEDLVSATADCEPRLAELARLYAAYQAWLLDTGWADAEGQGWLAAIALEDAPVLLSNLSLLVVDGFDEFNPTQLEVLRLLAGRAVVTLITLTGDPGRPNRLAHRRFARALSALTDALGVDPTPLPEQGPGDGETRRREVDAPLAHLETSLFEPNPTPLPADGLVEFIEAQSRAAEAREALRWLKARIVRDGVPLPEVAIVVRDVAPYRPFLEEVAAEFGMPLRFASGTPLRTNPAIAALLNLLSLPLGSLDWSPRALLDALTSPYFDWSTCDLLPGDADRLGDVAREGQVVSGLDQWHEALQRLAARTPAARAGATPELLDEEGPIRHHPPAGTQATRLEAAFEAAVARVTPPSVATLRERVAWVEEFIGGYSALAPPGAARLPIGPHLDNLDNEASLHAVTLARQNSATAERDVAALLAFKDILRGLMLADLVIEKVEDGILPYDWFVAGLIQAVEDATYNRPVEGPAILVASAAEVRGLTFDSVALLGLAEGGFPRAEREDVLLRESDRAWLSDQGFDIEQRLQGDEATFFYQAVTRARRRLLLCRPYLADDGQAWEPSPYWSTVLALFKDLDVPRIRSTDPVSAVASEQERVTAAPGDETNVAVAVLDARSRSDPSPWRGDLSALEVQLTERFGPDRPWSSSRLETYAKCPFYFWATYVMELEPREPPQAGFDVLTLGSIYHLILERLYAHVPDGDPDRLRATLPAVARQVYEAAPNDYGFRPTPLWERQQEELTDVLRRTLDALIEVAGDYKPSVPELAFGLQGRLTLVLRGEHPLQLRGYIDRVDRASDGRIRIIDYKAGSTPISARDLAEGRRLQLPLYALAAQEALGEDVASGFYWHIGSARPSSLKLETYEGGVAGAIETAVAHAQAIVAAVRAGQFSPTPPAPPRGGCPAFCPAVAFCERYKPKAW